MWCCCCACWDGGACCGLRRRVQAYGVMLSEDGEYNGARAQFRAAASADEFHLPVWQAWAVMECKLKNYDRARRLFQRGVWAAPKDPNLVWLWQVRRRAACCGATGGTVCRTPGLSRAVGLLHSMLLVQ